MAREEPLSIRQLEVFVALVDHRSFTAAARSLGLGQSTVSGHMADLERRIGLRLVDRDRSGIEPTSEGAEILEFARTALQAERNARMAAAEMTGLLAGTLAIGASTIPAVYLVPPFVAHFRQRYPGIAVRLRTGDSQEMLEALQAGEVDVALVGVEPRPSEKGLTSSPLGRDELVLVCPPGHELAGALGVTLQDVAGHPMVMREEGSGTRATVIEKLRSALDGKLPEVSCEVGSTEAVKAAVRAGLGLSFVSNLAVREDLTSGSLGFVPLEDFEVRRSFHLVTRSEDRLGPAGRAFRDQVLEASASG